jgi:cell division protein FtsI/penicillin-binding protein 2
MMALADRSAEALQPLKRVRMWYGVLILIVAIFGIRLFYLQVIRYGHYKTAALSDQLKEYQIPASRGIISAYNGSSSVPIVLNQTLYTLYADPTFVKQPQKVADTLSNVLGSSPDTYLPLLTKKGTRYAVLGKKLTKAQKTAILSHKYPGVGAQAQDYRVYPQGSLAAQLLGFVNDAGTGTYGIEQALNRELAGQSGELKAITDVHGVPLAANQSNTSKPAIAGDKVQLTIDIGMQQQMEKILQTEYQKTKSKGISAIIMDPHTGQIKAMANYPSYDPSHYNKVSDSSLFQNNAVSNAIEPGSTMKLFTTAAALDQGVVNPSTSFYDPAHWVVDGYNITDIEEDGGARQQNVSSILSLSLNTGATWLLMQMGGGQINMKGINAWHNYLAGHYRFGMPTNIEQGYESNGLVPAANPHAPAVGLTFANTSFGQGLQVTDLQMAAAISAILNGGTYYQPTLVASTTRADGGTSKHAPKVLERHVVSTKVSQEMQPLMENVVNTYFHEGFSYMSYPAGYIVGGKTGTAQIAQPGGGYYDNLYNGTYVGFVGGDTPRYVIAVFNIQPDVSGYAGSYGGQPVFGDLAHMLINDGYVTPGN